MMTLLPGVLKKSLHSGSWRRTPTRRFKQEIGSFTRVPNAESAESYTVLRHRCPLPRLEKALLFQR